MTKGACLTQVKLTLDFVVRSGLGLVPMGDTERYQLSAEI